MASFEGSIGTPSGKFNLMVEYSVSQSISGNYSDVSATAYVKRNDSNYWPYNGYGGDGNLSIDGDNKYERVAYDLRSDGYKQIMSHSKRVYHNSDGTKSINISFSFDGRLSNGYPNGSISQTVSLPTIPRYANITSFSVSKVDETSVQFNWSADASCDWAWYSTDDGNNWNNLPNSNIIGGLSANTWYALKLRVRRTDSGLTTDSDVVWQQTYDYPHLEYASDFTIGENINVNIYNPLNRWMDIYFIGNDNSTICTASRNNNGSMSIGNTAQEIENQYYSIPNSSSGNYRVRLVVSSLGRDTTVSGGRYYARESDCKPSVSAIFKDIKQSSINQTGDDNIIVKGISNMQVSVSTTLRYNASVKSYYISCGDGQSGTSQNTVIYRPKSPIVKVTVIDSRDFSDTADYDLTTLNQWLNYIELAYTSDIDLKRSEQLSDQVILNVQGNYFNGKLGTTAGLRNVHVGDDLSGKTIYFDFYGRIHYLMKHYDENNKDIIVADKKITQELFENQSGNDEAIIKAGTAVLYDAEYIMDPVSSYEYDIVNLDHLDLPNDFGIVTAINDELLTYGDIYILSTDTPVDNNNSLSMYFQYKLSGTNNWSNAITINPTISGNGFYVNNLILGNNFDHNNEYVFRVITSDKLMRIGDYIEEVVTKATPVIRIGDEFVQVNGDLLINDGKVFASYTLYDNSSGEIGDITLNDFVSNYEYLEIIFKDNVEAIGSVKMIPSYSTKCNLTVVAIDNSNIQYIKNRQLNVSGNQITNYQSLHEGSMGNDGSQSVYTLTTAIKILKVIGYK